MLPETARLLDEISQISGIEQYFLVGGTALALHASHRLSEDLDFATCESTLDAHAISTILARMRQSHTLQDATSPADLDAALNEGLDLAKVQQNWLVDKVRLTFFVIGDTLEERLKIGSQAMEPYGKTRIMGLEGLFLTKCLALCDRVKSRDIYDLHWLIRHGGRSISEIFETIQESRSHITYDAIRYRLLDWPIPKTDEGFVSVVNNGSLVAEDVSIESIRKELRGMVCALEVRLAQGHRPGV